MKVLFSQVLIFFFIRSQVQKIENSKTLVFFYFFFFSYNFLVDKLSLRESLNTLNVVLEKENLQSTFTWCRAKRTFSAWISISIKPCWSCFILSSILVLYETPYLNGETFSHYLLTTTTYKKSRLHLAKTE